ncbi:MAG: acylphosphatase [Patescibacteria group bacterium]|nr:acylphosphatase [Patescibacteria group bacterium]
MEKTLTIKVTGRVQGVGFRWCAYEQFVDLGLTGKAENGRDGSVEITASGEEAALQKLVEWCHLGPKGARVNRVEVGDAQPSPAATAQPAKTSDHERSDT